MYNQIQSSQIRTIVEAIHSIDKISQNHPQAIPVYFIEWRKSHDYYLKNNYIKDKIDNEFINHIESNYIWLRKKFKYDNEKVQKENLKYLDCYQKKSFYADILNSAIYILLTILLILGLAAIVIKENNIAYVSLSGFGVGTLVYFIKNYVNKWGY